MNRTKRRICLLETHRFVIIDRVALEKQGDIALGSVHPSVLLSVHGFVRLLNPGYRAKLKSLPVHGVYG